MLRGIREGTGGGESSDARQTERRWTANTEQWQGAPTGRADNAAPCAMQESCEHTETSRTARERAIVQPQQPRGGIGGQSNGRRNQACHRE